MYEPPITSIKILSLTQSMEEKRNYKLKIDKKIFFYPEDFLHVLELATDKQKFNLLCMINTGARINEIRHVVKKDLDKERYNLTLWITKVRAKLKETRPSPRTIPISTQFFKYIYSNIDNYKMYSTNHYDTFLKELSVKAKVKNPNEYSSHNMRKTFGTWMLALGVDGFKLAQHLGHSPDMLRTHYASPDIFNFRDKDIMRDILGDLPNRLRN
jgi:integrase